jgi:hypothetical protein
VQALKRHRDIFFNGRLAERPASIIITTLAARAYQGGDEVYDVLRTVTARMGDMVEFGGSGWRVPNPVREDEDFAETWVEHPERAGWFFEWLEAASNDFNGLGTKSGLDYTVPRLRAAFGKRFAEAAGRGYGTSIYDARTSQQLRLSTGAGLVTTAAASSRKVREHGFEGGTAQ